jgi:hypothetical protein
LRVGPRVLKVTVCECVGQREMAGRRTAGHFVPLKQDPAPASPAAPFPSDRQARGRAAVGRRVRREAQGRGRRAQRAS